MWRLRLSQLGLLGPCRWGRAAGGVLFPPPAPSRGGRALVGRELRPDSGPVLETSAGCLGPGGRPWAGLTSAPLPSSSPDLHLPADQLAPAALPVSWEVLGWAVESGDVPSNGDRPRAPITFWGRKALVTREPPGAIMSISEAVPGF